MAQKRTKEDDMDPLNVDLPRNMIALLRLAKALTNKPIRLIVAEALGTWMKQHGITEDKLKMLKK